MILKKTKNPTIVLSVLLVVLSFTSPSFAEKENASNKITEGYSRDIKFHSSGHLTRWDKSPIKNNYPHLTLILSIMAILGVGVAVSPLFKKKKDLENSNELDVLINNLEAKKLRLAEKLNLLEEKDNLGEIKKEEFNKQKNKYQQELEQIENKLKQLKNN